MNDNICQEDDHERLATSILVSFPLWIYVLTWSVYVISRFFSRTKMKLLWLGIMLLIVFEN